MDEFLDLFDILADVADLGDMADAGIELGQVIAELDIADLDAGYLEGLAELDDTWLPDPEDGFEAAIGIDVEPDLDVSDPSLEVLGAEQSASTSIDDVLASYPEHIREGLPRPSYSPSHHPTKGSGYLGECIPATGEINLYDHADTIEGTLHHEIGHFLIENRPELKAKLVDALSITDYADSKVGHLSGYEATMHDSELCAEAFLEFKQNPTAFGHLYPSVAAVLKGLLT